ncbi:MAG: TadE/TadG family type IV pilus assembly protein [Actinomycetota bacterium]
MEFSLVLPLLVALMVGIMELGMAFRDVLTTSSAVREGTRVLSALGNDPDADCTALIAAIDTLLLGGSIDQLQRVEIYRADSDGDQVPADTNTYTLTGTDYKDCDDWATAIGWPSVGRNVIAGGSPPLDIAGMRIIYRHDYVIGLPPFSGGFTIDQTTISRLEPEEFA